MKPALARLLSLSISLGIHWNVLTQLELSSSYFVLRKPTSRCFATFLSESSSRHHPFIKQHQHYLWKDVASPTEAYSDYFKQLFWDLIISNSCSESLMITRHHTAHFQGVTCWQVCGVFPVLLLEPGSDTSSPDASLIQSAWLARTEPRPLLSLVFCCQKCTRVGSSSLWGGSIPEFFRERTGRAETWGWFMGPSFPFSTLFLWFVVTILQEKVDFCHFTHFFFFWSVEFMHSRKTT